jgi:hypothetical protein
MCNTQLVACCEAIFHWSTGRRKAYLLNMVLLVSWSGNPHISRDSNELLPPTFSKWPLVIKDKALVRLQEPDKRIGRYYRTDAVPLGKETLCVDAISSMPCRTRIEQKCGGATTHCSVLHIGVGMKLSAIPELDSFECLLYGFEVAEFSNTINREYRPLWRILHSSQEPISNKTGLIQPTLDISLN